MTRRPVSKESVSEGATRLLRAWGAAYDWLGNGKVKLYGSFWYFYDMMKYQLPRGCFGGDYWHDCVYALDTPDFTQIIPQRDSQATTALLDVRFSPPSGSAAPLGGRASGVGHLGGHSDWVAAVPAAAPNGPFGGYTQLYPRSLS